MSRSSDGSSMTFLSTTPAANPVRPLAGSRWLRGIVLATIFAFGLIVGTPASWADDDLVAQVNEQSKSGAFGSRSKNPAVAGVRDTVTGQVYFDGNKTQSEFDAVPLHPIIEERIKSQRSLVDRIIDLPRQDQDRILDMSHGEAQEWLKSQGVPEMTQGMDNAAAVLGIAEKLNPSRGMA